MDLDRLVVDLRPRPAWEAIDLGFRMARAHYARLIAISLCVTLPLFLVAQAAFWRWPLIAVLIPWWAKPVWERCHLHLLSRTLFGEEVGVAETVRTLPRYGFGDALAWLTVRRLSPTRSMDLPVTQLEALRGADRTRRLAVLRRGPFATAALWLTVVCAHVEAMLPVAVLVLAAMLVPERVDFDPIAWAFEPGAHGRGGDFVIALLAHGAALLVAPFYVAAGFSLYLHRRALLEGWDLEIAFKRLAGRVERAPRPHRAAAGALAALLGLSLALGVSSSGRAAPHGSASEPVPAEQEIAAARAEIAAVLEDEAFHAKRTVSLPRFVHECQLEEVEADEPPALPAWFETLARVLATSAEVVLVAASVGLFGWLVLRGLRAGAPAGGASRRRAAPRPPARVLGLDVTPESLPEDVAGSVRSLWRAGAHREAMALLYRASLARLVERHAVELRESDTEGECLSAARARLDPGRAGVFAEVTRLWRLVAYAHRTPSDAGVERVVSAWAGAFAGGGGPERTDA